MTRNGLNGDWWLCRAAALVVSCTMVAAFGCAGSEVYTPHDLPLALQSQMVPAGQNLDLTHLASQIPTNRRIAPGDLLQVTVTTGLERAEDAAWPPVRVSEHGAVTLPLIGRVELAGLELPQAEHRVYDESIRRGVFRNPQVSVVQLQRRTHRVTVVGEVNVPGAKEIAVADSHLLAAIVEAGGLTEEAGAWVDIRQPGNQPPVRIGLTEATWTPGQLQLGDGAVVMIPRRATQSVQVIGLVAKPDSIEMPTDKDMRLLEAIAAAGGVRLQVADKVKVIRYPEGSSEPVIIQTSIKDAKSDGVSNIRLSAGDIVSVEETPTTFTVALLQSFVRFGFSSAIPF